MCCRYDKILSWDSWPSIWWLKYAYSFIGILMYICLCTKNTYNCVKKYVIQAFFIMEESIKVWVLLLVGLYIQTHTHISLCEEVIKHICWSITLLWQSLTFFGYANIRGLLASWWHMGNWLNFYCKYDQIMFSKHHPSLYVRNWWKGTAMIFVHWFLVLWIL